MRGIKNKIVKEKPIKITAGTPDGEPDPAQTKLKTVHEPISKESGWLPLGVSSNVLIETEWPKRKENTSSEVQSANIEDR